MFKRHITTTLLHWRAKKDRKPLIIRGARQVGKTTLVHQFGQEFSHYIYLNLERESDRRHFEEYSTLDDLLKRIFFEKDIPYDQRSETLLFIDEIQALPETMQLLRFFYEDASDLAVIAAGSMLESILRSNISIPVGRVEYLVLRPVSFGEFLEATGEHASFLEYQKVPVPEYAHEKLFSLFHTYALVGGMPEAVRTYAQTKDLRTLDHIYDSLTNAYMEDVEKYAISKAQVQTIRHAIRTCFGEAGKRIKFQGFGRSNYASREMGEALRTLEKTFLIQLIYPTVSSILPLVQDHRKSPRLQFLDTGMINYFVGLRSEILSIEDLQQVYQGLMLEHLCGQEILASQYKSLSALHFWTREKSTSQAEVDYVIQHESLLIPIEVKSGKTGKLKSLMLYMDETSHDIAVRLYHGKIEWQTAETPRGKKFRLLNLPYYLAGRVGEYL
jgi:predicted AAA+ superfamily ATPase